jgi:hypothetical protein
MKFEKETLTGCSSVIHLTVNALDVLDMVQNLVAMLAGQKSHCVFRSFNPAVEFCLEPALSGYSILLRREAKPGWPELRTFTFAKKSAEDLAVKLLRHVICGDGINLKDYGINESVQTDVDEFAQLRIRFDFEKFSQ